jgi:GTPase SAR1 family protein
MIIEDYLQNIQEGYLFSDKTISVNLHEFENKTKNKLLIIGVPGSGKTSLAKHLLKKYNVNDFVSDDHWKKMLEGLTSSKRTIIEGAGLASLYGNDDSWKKLIIEQPMILMGMSAIKAGWRADKRDGLVPGKVKDWKDTYYFMRSNITYFQKFYNLLRNDVMKLSGATIKEYKVPKFKTVLY